MDSEPNSSEIPSVSETLIGNRDLSVFMPFLFGFTNTDSLQESQNPSDPDWQNENQRIFLVNPFTQSMVVIEGRSSLEALLRDLSGKEGQPPASKGSIEALPTVQLMEEELASECVICLDDWESGDVAKELPCKHKFHPNCVEKWLGIHGTCPVCRHNIDGTKNDVGLRGRTVREIWVAFSFNNERRSDDSNPVSTDHEVEV